MAQGKDEITYGTAQAKISEDDAFRIRYKAGTPLEGGKIADSEPIDLFSSAHNIQRAKQQEEQQQQKVETGSAATGEGRGQVAGGKDSSNGTS